MSTKLTLTIEKSVISKAKIYAERQGRSLSAIIESYLKLITSREKNIDGEGAPLTKKLKGSFKTNKSFDYKKELSDRLSEKYL